VETVARALRQGQTNQGDRAGPWRVPQYRSPGAAVGRDIVFVRNEGFSRGRSWAGGRRTLDKLLAGNAGKTAREQLTLICFFEELRGRG
jgi:hypothetical protein